MYKIYDFQCPVCKVIKEVIVENKEIPKCSVCKCKMNKLMSGPPFHLKGDGWASDNYGLKKENKK